MNLLVQLVKTFGLLSLLSIGGANATIPEIHRQVVGIHHWMDDSTFATLVAIGQTAPGPNVLIVSMIGWHLAGLAGLLAATFAVVLPSSIIALALERVLLRHQASEGVALARCSLAPVAVGFILAGSIVMATSAYVNVLSLMIVGVVAGLVALTRLSPLWTMAGGVALGLVGHRLHVFG